MENEVPKTNEEEQAQETQAPVPEAAPETPPVAGPSSDEKSWAMGCHLIALVTSFVGPLILWLIKREGNPYIDKQGKEALNFQLTILICFAVCWVLTFIVIGALLMPLVWVANIIFIIIAAVKANSGEDYRYPLCIRLIK